jgi:lipoate-protein ligase A
MGLDEALLESCAGKITAGGGTFPVLRFYGWEPPAVSIGYFQGMTEEVDTGAAQRLGFDLVRRISGGGAVLHRSELTYSIIMKDDHPFARKDFRESYRVLSGGLIRGFAIMGIEADFSGINDIMAQGKKISGNAQTRRMGCLLQHGTILLDNDSEAMFKVLKVPEEKIKGKSIAEAKERVTSLRMVLGREIGFAEAETAFINGFSEAFGLQLEASEPCRAEECRAKELAEQKFSSREWLYKK